MKKSGDKNGLCSSDFLAVVATVVASVIFGKEDKEEGK